MQCGCFSIGVGDTEIAACAKTIAPQRTAKRMEVQNEAFHTKLNIPQEPLGLQTSQIQEFTPPAPWRSKFTPKAENPVLELRPQTPLQRTTSGSSPDPAGWPLSLRSTYSAPGSVFKRSLSSLRNSNPSGPAKRAKFSFSLCASLSWARGPHASHAASKPTGRLVAGVSVLDPASRGPARVNVHRSPSCFKHRASKFPLLRW